MFMKNVANNQAGFPFESGNKTVNLLADNKSIFQIFCPNLANFELMRILRSDMGV